MYKWMMSAVVFWLVIMGLSAAFGSEEGLLLHLSFDGKITADFAKGKAEGCQKNPEHTVTNYIQGVKDKAVLLNNGNIYYEAKNNFRAPAGTVMFWAKPVEWDPQKPAEKWTSFFSAYQRIGRGGEDMIAFWRYPQTMTGGLYQYHSAQGSNLGNFCFEIKDWEKNQWKFFAFTWDEKGMAKIFIDGKLFSQMARETKTLAVDINELSIGESGTAYDEFRVFNRALADEEIQAYYAEAGQEVPKSGATAAPATPAIAGEITFPQGSPRTCASPIEGPIEIDGILNEPAWDNCVEFQDMSLSTFNKCPLNRTSFRIGYTRDVLYMAVVVFERAGEPKITVREHGGPVYTDDSIEIFLAPEQPVKEYYQFVANAVAARYEGRGMDGSWDGKWQAAATRQKGKWFLEIAIPFSTIGVTPASGKILGFNVCRNDQSANQSQTWADLGGYAFHTPSRFGELLLAKAALGATGTSMIFRRNSQVAVNALLKNAGEAPVDAQWLVAGNAGGSSFRFQEAAKIDSKKEKMIERTGALSGIKGSAGWRSALWADGELLYLSPPRMADFLDLPPLLEARAPLTLANNKVSLQFDAYSGALVSLKNLATGLELIPRHEPQPLFGLDAVSYQKHPMFFNEQDVIPLEASHDSARECKVEKRVDGTQVLRAVHTFKEGVTGIVTVELPPDTEISKWNIRVENRLPQRPREAVIIQRAVFPQLGGLRAAEKDNDQALAWPRQAGSLVPEPARKASDLLKLESPGSASMTWADLSGTNGGLYLATHDINPAINTIFEAKGDVKNTEVGLTIRRWSLLWPGKDWQPEACSLGMHSGDWHWSADRYREWFYKNCPVRPAPQWLRNEDAWLMDGGGPNRAVFADIAGRLTTAQAMGINYLQSWQYHMATESDETYAMQMPNVYGGTEKEFIKALADVHKRGGRIGFYFNAGDYELRAGGMMRQPKYLQKFPDDIVKILPAADPLTDGWLAMGRIMPDGSQHLGWPSGIDMRQGCYGSKGWSDWVYFWVTRYANKYKADTWYQDIAPWSAAGVCFHPAHGHDGPIQHGQATIDCGNRIVKAVGKDYAIAGEGTSDRLWNYQTHSLWCHGVGEENYEPALFVYTHPRHPLFCGTCCFWWGGKSNLNKNFYKDQIEKPVFADLMRFALLYGQRFDTFNGPPRSGEEYLDAAMKEERDIIMLRRAIHDDLEKSAFKDEIGLSGIPANVKARVFMRDDKKGALIAVLDFRKEKKPFTLMLDAAKHDLKLPAAAEIVLPGGKVETFKEMSQKDNIIQLPLTASSEKIFFIRLKSGR